MASDRGFGGFRDKDLVLGFISTLKSFLEQSTGEKVGLTQSGPRGRSTDSVRLHYLYLAVSTRLRAWNYHHGKYYIIHVRSIFYQAA